jgi:anti-sigma regulatory factor (Ser/Thr protein kinase)
MEVRNRERPSVKPRKKDGKTRPAGSVREFILKKISQHPADIVSIVSTHFNISPEAVQKQLRHLKAEGQVEKHGRTRDTTWTLAPKNKWRKTLKVHDSLREDVIWSSFLAPKIIKPGVAENVQEIVRYGFTEMLNNVIDHSSAKNVTTDITDQAGILSISIGDDGVGIFQKLQKAFELADPKESILELSKGKLTTDPKRHSGEGIFFTSRAFDRFELASRGLVFIKDNLHDDWLIDTREGEKVPGTQVLLKIRKDAPNQLTDIFKQYTDPETQSFNRTYIVVELAKTRETEYVSRSQAKRILTGLEKFRYVVLDFRNVRTVGQAFVDEVFRVFANTHPEVQFDNVNMNKNVEFMITRGLATAARS